MGRQKNRETKMVKKRWEVEREKIKKWIGQRQKGREKENRKKKIRKERKEKKVQDVCTTCYSKQLRELKIGWEFNAKNDKKNGEEIKAIFSL